MVGVMHHVGLLNDRLAGSAVDVDQKVPGQLTIGPEGQRPKLPGFLEVFGDPSAVGIQDLRKADDQGVEEALARSGGRAFEDNPQGAVFVDNSPWRLVRFFHGCVLSCAASLEGPLEGVKIYSRPVAAASVMVLRRPGAAVHDK